jgi:hypothetical protein
MKKQKLNVDEVLICVSRTEQGAASETEDPWSACCLLGLCGVAFVMGSLRG